MRAVKFWAAIFGVCLTGAAAPGQADQTLVERGAYLARAGDCESCHTAPGNKPYSGGEAVATPFGPIYPPNITPDKAQGIGAWTDDQFYKALHDGIGHKGEFLYPAMPYPWYTKVTHDDVMAIRAFLNTVPPVDLPSKPPQLVFPFNIRLGLAGWDAAFFKAGEFKPDPTRSAQWNRGAYLVEGLGHCGDCHTPKGLAMEPIHSKAFSGGSIQDWYAPDITSNVGEGIGAWSNDDLVKFLKTGVTPNKGVVAGKMSQVVHDSLKFLTDDDVRAIATFLEATPPIATYDSVKPAKDMGPHALGETVYLNHCASCHQPDGRGISGAVPALAGNGLVKAKGPEDVIRVILEGHLAMGSYAAMPAIGADLTDEQIAEVTDYVRNAWSNAAPVIEKRGLVSEIRDQTKTTVLGQGKVLVNNDPCYSGEDQHVKPIEDPLVEQTLSSLKGDTMLPAMEPLIQHVHAIDPKLTQAEIVNGLAISYCRVEAKDGQLSKPKGRQLITQFLSNLYTELASNGHE